MHFNIITLFPEFFQGPLTCGLMLRAREAGLLTFDFVNPREAAVGKRHAVDDRPFGGGPGMVMLPAPLAAVLRRLGFGPRGAAQPGRLIYLTPTGKSFSQKIARELAGTARSGETPRTNRLSQGRADGCRASATGLVPAAAQRDSSGIPPGASARPGHERPDSPPCAKLDAAHSLQNEPYRPEQGKEASLTLLCGRYEGIDARIEELFPVETISVGDFVLNGGEAAALCVIEAVSRLLPGYMGHEESGTEESFAGGLLEYPHYTRPEVFEGLPVPDVLRSGDHGGIALWRRQSSLARTLESRPELLDEADLEAEDRDFLRRRHVGGMGRNLFCSLVHYPVLDKAANSVSVSLTNLDIHDIARSSCTYGLGGYYVLTPLRDQRDLLETIVGHWTTGAGKSGNPDRAEALGLVRSGRCIEDAVRDIQERTGQEPLVVGTTARRDMSGPAAGFARIAGELQKRPVLLLFGTGHGLSPEAQRLCQAFAPPIRWLGPYNHLSVRSAAVVILDRILGDWR